MNLKHILAQFAVFTMAHSATAFAHEVETSNDAQVIFDELATIIVSKDAEQIDARFARRISTLSSTTAIRLEELSAKDLLRELDGCSYSGGKGLRMLWICKNRKPPNDCFSGNVLVRFWRSFDETLHLGVDDERINDDKSCWPTPPQRISVKPWESN